MRRAAAERFWAKVEKTPGCWLWTAGRSAWGYGVFLDDAHHSVGAHRWAWLDAHGPIPAGIHLDHLCRVRHCVNPAHLELVTPGENTRRGLGPATAGLRMRQKTHCPYGHAYTPDNVYLYRGKRSCKRCHARVSHSLHLRTYVPAAR